MLVRFLFMLCLQAFSQDPNLPIMINGTNTSETFFTNSSITVQGNSTIDSSMLASQITIYSSFISNTFMSATNGITVLDDVYFDTTTLDSNANIHISDDSTFINSDLSSTGDTLIGENVSFEGTTLYSTGTITADSGTSLIDSTFKNERNDIILNDVGLIEGSTIESENSNIKISGDCIYIKDSNIITPRDVIINAQIYLENSSITAAQNSTGSGSVFLDISSSFTIMGSNNLANTGRVHSAADDVVSNSPCNPYRPLFIGDTESYVPIQREKKHEVYCSFYNELGHELYTDQYIGYKEVLDLQLLSNDILEKLKQENRPVYYILRNKHGTPGSSGAFKIQEQ